MKILSYYNPLASTLQCDCQTHIWRTNMHSLIQLLILHPLISLFSGQRKSNTFNHHQNFPWQFTKLWNSVLLKAIFMVPFSCFIQCKSSVIRFKTNLGREYVFSTIKSLQWVVLRNRTHTCSVLSSLIKNHRTSLMKATSCKVHCSHGMSEILHDCLDVRKHWKMILTYFYSQVRMLCNFW